MEDFVFYNDLFDIYGCMLTEKQQDIFRLYYGENLSMQEIADNNQVSKAFVGKVIKDVETKLTQLEKTFKLLSYKKKLVSLQSETNIETIKKEISKIVDSI